MTVIPPPLPPAIPHNGLSLVKAARATSVCGTPIDKRMKLGINLGAYGSCVMISVFITAFWVHSHSPHMGFGEMMAITAQDPKFEIVQEPFYTLIMILVAIVALVGLVSLVFGIVLVSVSLCRNDK